MDFTSCSAAVTSDRAERGGEASCGSPHLAELTERMEDCVHSLSKAACVQCHVNVTGTPGLQGCLDGMAETLAVAMPDAG